MGSGERVEDAFEKLIFGEAGAKQIVGMMMKMSGEFLNQQTETMKTMTKTQSGDPNMKGIKFDIKYSARMEKVKSGKADYKVWLSDVITIVGSLGARVGDTIRVLVEENNKLRRGKSKGIMDVSIDPGTGRTDEKSLTMESVEEGTAEIKKVVVERGGA